MPSTRITERPHNPDCARANHIEHFCHWRYESPRRVRGLHFLGGWSHGRWFNEEVSACLTAASNLKSVGSRPRDFEASRENLQDVCGGIGSLTPWRIAMPLPVGWQISHRNGGRVFLDSFVADLRTIRLCTSWAMRRIGRVRRLKRPRSIAPEGKLMCPCGASAAPASSGYTIRSWATFKLTYEAMELPSDPGLTMFAFLVSTVMSADALALLASWVATQRAYAVWARQCPRRSVSAERKDDVKSTGFDHCVARHFRGAGGFIVRGAESSAGLGHLCPRHPTARELRRRRCGRHSPGGVQSTRSHRSSGSDLSRRTVSGFGSP